MCAKSITINYMYIYSICYSESYRSLRFRQVFSNLIFVFLKKNKNGTTKPLFKGH